MTTYDRVTDDSVFIVAARYFSSWPFKISSTSLARNKIRLVGNDDSEQPWQVKMIRMFVDVKEEKRNESTNPIQLTIFVLPMWLNDATVMDIFYRVFHEIDVNSYLPWSEREKHKNRTETNEYERVSRH
jgi:hypothetical protein